MTPAFFVIRFADHPERRDVRAATLQAHLDWVAATPDVLAAGSLRAAAGDPPSGAVWIVRAESKAAAEQLYLSDPFWTGGLRASVEILEWSPADPQRPFAPVAEVNPSDPSISHTLYDLKEAAESLAHVIKTVEAGPLEEWGLAVDVAHIYHHLNSAWNARNASDEAVRLCTKEDYFRWRRFPDDLPDDFSGGTEVPGETGE